MIERLRDKPDDLEAIVGITAEALGMPALYVEKDFWVTEVLRAASADRTVALPDGSTAPVTFTFKGGTSLGRVFSIVERFSEDVDLLAVFPPEASAGARHKVLKEVDQAVRGHLALADLQVLIGSSTTGVKRYTTYIYPTGNHDPLLKEGVLGVLGETETTWEEFAEFSVNVLAPERTLFEKLAAVHDAATRNDRDALLKHGRHFYDIHCLIQDERVIEALETLGSDGIRALVDDIESQIDAAGFSSTPRPIEGYALSSAFDAEHSTRGTIEAGYEGAQALIYGVAVPFSVVLNTVRYRRELL